MVMCLRFCICFLLLLIALPTNAAVLRALIIDGQNNHKCWPQTTQIMKRHLEDTEMFSVDIATHAPQGEDPSFQFFF